MEVSPACYSHLITPLMGLAEGKVAVFLEGGYCLKSLAEGAAMTLRSLLRDPAPSLVNFGTPCDSVVETILNVIYVHKPYWQCFQLQDTYGKEINENVMKTRKKVVENISPNSIKKHVPVIKFLGSEVKPSSYPTRQCYPLADKDYSRKMDEKLDQLKIITDLKVPPRRVAIAYDEKMIEHFNIQEGNHPEKPERIVKIFRMLHDFRLLSRCAYLKVSINLYDFFLNSFVSLKEDCLHFMPNACGWEIFFIRESH